jgi:hypothetical protein
MPTSCESTTGSLKCPPSGTVSMTTKPPVVVRTSLATVLGQQPVDPLTVAIAPAAAGRSSLTAILAVEAATVGAPTMGLTGELGAEATAAAEATRRATSPVPHVEASTPARKSKNYDARRPPRQATTTASPPSLRDFATLFSRRNSSLWDYHVRREVGSGAVAQMLRPLH